METVEILHRKLDATQQTRLGPWLVTKLVLNLVELERQILIRADEPFDQRRDDFFVRPAQAVQSLAAALKLKHHFRSRIGPTAGFLPQVLGVQRRHQELLAADRVHLFADNLLDVI